MSRQACRLAASAVAIALLAAGCAVPRGPLPSGGADGPPAEPPADIAKTPDAEPRIETIRPGGANKPYQIGGIDYTPRIDDRPYTQRGAASWYGTKFHGRSTASGEIYNMYAMTAAHPTWPIPSYARVRNPANGREVIVRINDRGPFHGGRVIDLSYSAASKLGIDGVKTVEITRLTNDEIRAGSWRQPPGLVLPSQQFASRLGANTPAEIGAAAAVTAAALPALPDVSPDDETVAGDGDAGVREAMPSMAGAATFGETSAVPAAAAVRSAAMRPAASAATATTAPIDDSGAVAARPPSAAASTPMHPEPSRAYVRDAKGFWVQLGAFRDRQGALELQQRATREFAAVGPLLAVFNEQGLHRLQAGPYAKRDNALRAAQRLHELLQLKPLIVRRH